MGVKCRNCLAVPIISPDNWLLFKPKKVLAIYNEDFDPGQLENFWTYVPGRLGGIYR